VHALHFKVCRPGCIRAYRSTHQPEGRLVFDLISHSAGDSISESEAFLFVQFPTI
jgi:hypothetical protein